MSRRVARARYISSMAAFRWVLLPFLLLCRSLAVPRPLAAHRPSFGMEMYPAVGQTKARPVCAQAEAGKPTAEFGELTGRRRVVTVGVAGATMVRDHGSVKKDFWLC